MRKVKILFFALLAGLFFVGTAYATTSGLSPESSLRAEIVDLIDHPGSDLLDGQSIVANIRLMVNDDDQLIVIDSGTTDPKLDAFLKSKLNYKKCNCKNLLKRGLMIALQIMTK